MTADSKLKNSEALLAHLRKKATESGRSSKTKAALDAMIRVQELVVKARQIR